MEKMLRWASFPKDEVPIAVYGLDSVVGVHLREPDMKALENSEIVIGFSASSDGSIMSPALILVGEGQESEIFSWLSVYAPETFPLSQFARVVSGADWQLLRRGEQVYQSQALREDRWACVIAGEILALGDVDTDVTSVPLSRAAGCFTSAIARTVLTHKNDKATHLCADRLRLAEADLRFVRRPVNVDSLLPIWALVQMPFDRDLELQNIAQLIIMAAQKYGFHDSSEIDFDASRIFLQYPGLNSDSVEERVVEFQRMSNAIEATLKVSTLGPIASAVLAAGAFLVGRGTTHAFILRKWSRIAPTALVWFSLLAALAGPRCWDRNWSRMVKSVEKQLRLGFQWDEPAMADLCWREYVWISKAHSGSEAFVRLPKLYPRLVSIEIVPGAYCQFRLGGGERAEASETDSRDKRSENQIREYRSALEQFISLAMRIKPIVDREGGGIARQSTLGLDDESISESPKYTRPRRTRR